MVLPLLSSCCFLVLGSGVGRPSDMDDKAVKPDVKLISVCQHFILQRRHQGVLSPLGTELYHCSIRGCDEGGEEQRCAHHHYWRSSGFDQPVAILTCSVSPRVRVCSVLYRSCMPGSTLLIFAQAFRPPSSPSWLVACLGCNHS